MTSLIAHISDLHFGTEDPRLVRGLHVRLSEIRPDLIIASGDFTSAGRTREFDDAARFIQRLPAPVIATPGNHDLPHHNLLERFGDPLRRYRAAIAPLTYTSFRSSSAMLLALNSARPWGLSLNWSHGRLSRRQIARADRFFSQGAPGALRALVVHHPFLVPEDLPGFRTIHRGADMLRVLANRGVRAIFSGHLHRQFSASRIVPLDAGDHEIMLIQASTATSHRRRDQPNAFNVIRVRDGRIAVTPEVWDGERFTPGGDKEPPRPSDRSPARASAAGAHRLQRSMVPR